MKIEYKCVEFCTDAKELTKFSKAAEVTLQLETKFAMQDDSFKKLNDNVAWYY